MGSAYDFNSLMYFLALRIGTRCLPVISFVGLESRGDCILFLDLGWQTNFRKSLRSWRLVEIGNTFNTQKMCLSCVLLQFGAQI